MKGSLRSWAEDVLGKRTLKRAWGKTITHPDRRDRWREAASLLAAREFMEEDGRSCSLGSGRRPQGPEMITTPLPLSPHFLEWEFEEAFLMSRVCETQRQGHGRTVHHTEKCSLSGKWSPMRLQVEKLFHKKSKGAKKEKQSPQTQEFLIGLPWELQRRLKIPSKVKQNTHWAHQIVDNTKPCCVTITSVGDHLSMVQSILEK